MTPRLVLEGLRDSSSPSTPSRRRMDAPTSEKPSACSSLQRVRLRQFPNVKCLPLHCRDTDEAANVKDKWCMVHARPDHCSA